MLTLPKSPQTRRRSCNSNYVCDCLEQPQFVKWYASVCTTSTKANVSRTSVGDFIVEPPPALFGNVDPLSILVALLTGMAMFVLIALSVLFARYRKRNQVVAQLEDGIVAAEQATQDAKSAVAKLTVQLQQAKVLVEHVMAEGGALLESYHLDYSDIDFAGQSGGERCKLGEGAQVSDEYS